ncbi:plasmid recombination protein [Eubacteriales bacterium OttesenSCG-928-N14]|nr:plasmid recombination protein [Eubacteriales bacterium OttesenSCG-928-N14]
MPQYGILRFAKHKGGAAGGLEAHHERTKEKYASNPDIDTSRSKYNFHIIRPAGRYRQEIDSRITAAGCRTRKDSTRFVDTLITASPQFFKDNTVEGVKTYFKRAAEFICRKIGKQNIVSAVVHMDEKTPHLHLTFVPLTEDNRLSAKDILGNRANLSKWQDEFHAHMVAAYPSLERGEPSRETGRRHIPMRVFKQSVDLTKQAQEIESLLTSINPLNAGKKRDEAMALLHKWFPKMEDFAGYLKKYRGTINMLAEEKATLADALAEKAAANSESKMQNRLEVGRLQSEIRERQRVIDLIPPDMLKELKAAQKEKQRKERGRER